MSDLTRDRSNAGVRGSRVRRRGVCHARVAGVPAPGSMCDFNFVPTRRTPAPPRTRTPTRKAGLVNPTTWQKCGPIDSAWMPFPGLRRVQALYGPRSVSSDRVRIEPGPAMLSGLRAGATSRSRAATSPSSRTSATPAIPTAPFAPPYLLVTNNTTCAYYWLRVVVNVHSAERGTATLLPTQQRTPRPTRGVRRPDGVGRFTRDAESDGSTESDAFTRWRIRMTASAARWPKARASERQPDRPRGLGRVRRRVRGVGALGRGVGRRQPHVLRDGRRRRLPARLALLRERRCAPLPGSESAVQLSRRRREALGPIPPAFVYFAAPWPRCSAG